MKSPAPDTFKIVKDIPRQTITFGVAKLPKSERVFLGSGDFTVAEADLSAAKFEAKELYKHESYVTSVTLAGSTLVSGGYDGKLQWYDVDKKATIRTIDAHSKWIRRVLASPDGSVVASVADDMLCKLWDAKTGKLIRELKGHELLTPQGFNSMLYAVAFSDDGKLIATGDKVGHIVVWEPVSGKQLATMEAPVMYTWDKVQRLHSIGGIRSLAFSADAKLLAVGGMGKVGNIDHLEGKARVEVFDWKSAKQVAEFPGEKISGLVNQLRWAKDSSWVMGIGGGTEGFVQFYDVTAKKVLKQDKFPTFVHDVWLSPDETAGIAVGHNKIVSFKLG